MSTFAGMVVLESRFVDCGHLMRATDSGDFGDPNYMCATEQCRRIPVRASF